MERLETIQHLTAMGDYWHEQYMAAERALRYAAEQMDMFATKVESLRNLGNTALSEPKGERHLVLLQGGDGTS